MKWGKFHFSCHSFSRHKAMQQERWWASPWPLGSTSPSTALPPGSWVVQHRLETSVKGIIPQTQAVNVGLQNPSDNLATHLVREKREKQATLKQRTLNFTNTGRATAGQPRLKERERAPPHVLTSPPLQRSLSQSGLAFAALCR